MTIHQALDMVRETLTLMLLLSMPILIASLVIGLVISVIQAVTQIHEQTLSFVPKMLAMGAAAIVMLPWIVNRIMEFSIRMFGGQ